MFSLARKLFCHPGAGRDKAQWIPACAGMTIYFVNRFGLFLILKRCITYTCAFLFTVK
jgi:hypothetical protein